MARKKRRKLETPEVPMNIERFKKEIGEFVAMVQSATATSGGERPLFPEFRLMEVIRAKMRLAVEKLGKADLPGAFETLEDVRRHLRNQQAAYAKGLVRDLNDELENAREAHKRGRMDEDLVCRISKAVREYTEQVQVEFFDITEASKKYWQTIDTINAAEDEYEQREKKREQEKARLNQEREQRRQQARQERYATEADNLMSLISSL